jgi:hypothetical protein
MLNAFNRKLLMELQRTFKIQLDYDLGYSYSQKAYGSWGFLTLKKKIEFK